MSSWRCIIAGENGNIPWWGADQPYHLYVNVAILEKAVAIWAVMALKVRQHLCRAVSRNSRFLTMYNRVLVMHISI